MKSKIHTSLESKSPEIVKELKNRLAKAVPLLDVRIFGSCARGDAAEDSDIDVFVETNTLSREIKRTVRHIAWEVGLERGVVISTLVFSRDELRNSPLRSSPVVLNIFREGIVV